MSVKPELWGYSKNKPFCDVMIAWDDYQRRRTELINCPPDREAPEWAEWKAQDEDGIWYWHGDCPAEGDVLFHHPASTIHCQLATHGKIPSGHRWQDTLTRINRIETTTHEEEEEFARIQARQDAERPHEADARQLDEQLERDIATFREVYKIAEDECAELYGKTSANSILNAAAEHMQDRAATYDKPEGERSMGATVEAFKATTGIELTEEQGWHFMVLLKMVRSQQGDYRADNFEDGAAYVALAGEAAAKERAK